MNLNEYLKKYGKPQNYTKGSLIFSQGQKNENLYFVMNGIIKAFYTSHEGKESVKSFICSGEFIGSLNSIYENGETSFALECIDDVEVICINFNELYKNSEKDIEICLSLVDGLLQLAKKKELREFEFLNLSPEERYLALKERNPQIINKVTQNDIARYLGITPVALSRIRRRIVENIS